MRMDMTTNEIYNDETFCEFLVYLDKKEPNHTLRELLRDTENHLLLMKNTIEALFYCALSIFN